jgi:hypothetical protein
MSTSAATPCSPARTRYAIVGLGSRAQMFVRALASTHAEHAELVAFCDVNRTRMEVDNRAVQEFGQAPVPTYRPEDFVAMLERERVDAVIVTTIDRTHDEYIVAALHAGCDVVTEKPMTTDAERCRRMLAAQAETGRAVTVTFNYRYNPVHARVREALAGGAIGEVGSVHFEWLLDIRRGADCFRRWHRDKVNSGGLMVHKATHHFDLVNWWIASSPEVVFGFGKLFFYGSGNGGARGLARHYERARGAGSASGDPFALEMACSPTLKALYLDAEHEDGYYRHGGGDTRMLAEIFGGERTTDPLGRASTHRDGALSLLTGLAANRSFETGLPVQVDDILSL